MMIGCHVPGPVVQTQQKKLRIKITKCDGYSKAQEKK